MILRGIPIVLINKIKVSTDPAGSPVFEEVKKIVDNVLVTPVTAEDVINTLNLTGRKAVYQLAIPKGDDNKWENQDVEFFGKRWHVFTEAEEGMEHLIPLSWNKKYKVERYE